MKQVIVTGSLAFDYIMDFPGTYEENILPQKLKTLSLSFLVEHLNKNFGGTAGNIAYNFSLLKSNPTILSSAGQKDFDEYRKHLIDNNIDASSINVVDNEFTATAYIITDKNNCQIAGFYGGAMHKDASLQLDRVKKNIDFLIISPTDPLAMENFVREAKQKGIPYLFDPAQALPRLSKAQLREAVDGADIVIGNDYEIALILERTGRSKTQLLKKTKILVTTLGVEGSLIETNDRQITVGIAKPKTVVDPTGAGDAYIAGFIAGYTRQLSLQICGQLGAVAGTFAIEQYGTQNHRFTQEEFNDRYKEVFGEIPKW